MTLMLAMGLLAPAFHGPIGPIDELALCIAPLLIVITVLVIRILSSRADSRVDRKRTRASTARGSRSRDR
jgi:hypothetical protein